MNFEFMTIDTPLPPCMPFPRALTGFPVSSTAKVMYCRMLDAMLFRGQADENGILFVCFPITAIAAVLSRSPMTVKRSLNEVGDKIDANDKAAVQADIDALKAVIAEITDDQNITDAQIESLKNGKEKLMESSQKVFSKMYEQAQAQAGAQGAGPDMGAQGAYQDPNAGAGADDVVDGDYKEV